ncbi:MAG: hypothetical protein QNJ97_08390 [Myxococcota bacterium]|nr:hypothetical protein [Myxococcota bacterium]
MKRILSTAVAMALVISFASAAGAETKQEYQHRFKLMLDYAVRTNEYIRQRLLDKGLAAYAHAMAEKNTSAAEQMTPPSQYAGLHPHFLLVLENIERSLFFAAKGELGKYRHYQRTVRKELQILEVLAEREHLELYMWDRWR